MLSAHRICCFRISVMYHIKRTFNFFTRLSIALFANDSDSHPCRWHIKLCTMLRHASADVGAVVMGANSLTSKIYKNILV